MIPNAAAAATTAGITSAVVRLPKAKRPTILVVGHPDGWFDLYADQRLDAAFALLPDVEGTEGERLAEAFIETQLSRRHREIYIPGRCELAGQIRPVKPSTIAARQTLLELHRAVSQLGRASA